ncbi:MAG: murein biosynthesis integral membrane protein MurJ [Candidatus Shapirobacteria bacterium]|nr:murein biosynthesis integral membrane protein MurJ [Candidatus Shapirobacteria bacterium]MDD5481430.1 murein biosynthesis integral membrane protein MurJ [Candidatus Shapirobacteria bacterium]
MINTAFKNGKKFFSQQQTSIFSAAFTIGLAMLGSAILGIFRDRLLYARFFAINPAQLDVYNAAFKIPDILFQILITGALSAAFIPIFSEWINKDEKTANRIASIMLNWLLLAFMGLGVLIFIFARPLSNLITFGFSAEQLDLMALLTRTLVLAQLFLLASNFLTSIIHSHQRFILPALSPILYNLGIIAGIVFLSEKIGILGPTIGVVVGAFFHLLIQVPLALSLGFSFRPLLFDFSDPTIKKIINLMAPRNISLIISQVEAAIIIYWATAIGEGMLSLFYLAQHLSQLPVRLIGATIGQATLPALSHQKAKNGLNSFGQLLRQTFSQTAYLALPVTALFLALRIPLVRLAFGAQEFPWEATVLTGKILAILSVAIFTQTLCEITRRAFYAFADTRTVLVVDGLATVFNLIFIICAANFGWGILGLTAGISLSNLIRLILFIIKLEKRINLINRESVIAWSKMAISGIISVLATWQTMRLLDRLVFDTSRVIPLIFLTAFSGLAGGLVYLACSWTLKISEFTQFANLAQKIVKKPNLLKKKL